MYVHCPLFGYLLISAMLDFGKGGSRAGAPKGILYSVQGSLKEEYLESSYWSDFESN